MQIGRTKTMSRARDLMKIIAWSFVILLTGEGSPLFAQTKVVSANSLPVRVEISRESAAPPSAKGGSSGFSIYLLPPLPPKDRTALAIPQSDPRKGPPAGISRGLSASALQNGVWRTNSASERYWQFSIQASEAAGVRLHFQNFDVGSGMVWVHDGDPRQGQVLGPYTGRGAFGDGEFWTEILFSDTAWIEYLAGPALPGDGIPFAVDRVFQLGKEFAERSALNTSCYRDVQCNITDARIRELAHAAALIITPSGTCTGALVNDTGSTRTPHFLTAGHCIESAQEARDSVFVFSFRTEFCGGSTELDWRRYSQVSGSELLSRQDDDRFDTLDYAFLRLSRLPLGEWWMMGWTTTSPSTSDLLLSVTHPKGLPQRFSSLTLNRFDNDLVMRLNPVEGALDKGSSGGAIASETGRLVGVSAFGPTTAEGQTNCDLAASIRQAGVIRFSAIFPRVSAWLNPADSRPATMTSPSTGATLPGSTVTFQWTRVAASEYVLYVGDQGAGSRNLLDRNVGDVQSHAVSALPTDGRRINVRLWSNLSDGWYSQDYVYTAATAAAAPAVMTSPAPGSTLAGGTVTFHWNRTAASEYFLHIGDQGVGSRNLYERNVGDVLNFSVSNLPTDGRRLNVRLWSHLSAGWYPQDYVYTAATAAAEPAVMTSPQPGTTLAGSSVTFQWTRVAATEYFLRIGDQGTGSRNFLDRNVGNVQSFLVSGLPTDGRRLNVQLWSYLSGAWYSRDYVYTAATINLAPAVMTSPQPGSTLAGSSVTFQWTRVAATEYFLRIGDQGAGSRNLLDHNVGNVQSFLVSGLPADGRRLNVQLWSYLSGARYSQDYVYTAATSGPRRISISIGQTVRGHLLPETSFRSVGCSECYADLYDLVSNGQALVITMSSDSFDAYIRVLDSAGREFAYDDDSGGNLNSRLVTFLPSGTYTIEATSFGGRQTGSYTLSVFRQ